MPTYAYKAKGADGVVVTGEVDAHEQRHAIDRLRAQKIVVLEMTERQASPLDFIFKKKKPPVESKDLVLFSRQLSTLVSAGVPIVQGLAILEEQTENPSFQEVLGEVRADIEGGLSISDALKKHPGSFPDIYCAMIRAGELGGILDTILERLSAFLESSEALKAKVKSAMMYPAIVLCICGVVTLFLLIFVIPTFKTIFSSFGAELPMPTQMLIDLADLLKKYSPIVVATPFVLKHVFEKYYATPAGKKAIDGLSLKAPVFGILLKKVAVAK
ncbi:MAG: type II secretion system F family protein, partial [Elusimicrobia bacterium]|nr:type II secretion system F family protein [Elusimicrobiota bacterium]